MEFFLEKLRAAKLVRRIPTVYATHRVITGFT
jgi:hypothetical protein